MSYLANPSGAEGGYQGGFPQQHPFMGYPQQQFMGGGGAPSMQLGYPSMFGGMRGNVLGPPVAPPMNGLSFSGGAGGGPLRQGLPVMNGYSNPWNPHIPYQSLQGAGGISPQSMQAAYAHYPGQQPATGFSYGPPLPGAPQSLYPQPQQPQMSGVANFQQHYNQLPAPGGISPDHLQAAYAHYPQAAAPPATGFSYGPPLPGAPQSLNPPRPQNVNPLAGRLGAGHPVQQPSFFG